VTSPGSSSAAGVANAPGFADAFWPDPMAHVFAAIGTQQSGVHPAVTGQQNGNPAIGLVGR